MVGPRGNHATDDQRQGVHFFTQGNVQMIKFKVVDQRNQYREDPNCEITHDNENSFVVKKTEIDSQGNKICRVLMLNPSKFQEERIVDEQEATVLMLKGIKVVEVKNDENE